MKTKLLILGFIVLLAVGYGILRSQSSAPPVTAKPTPVNGERAFDDLKNLVGFGPRPAGSDALAKARAYIVSELEKAGLKPIQDEFEGHTPRGNIKMVNIRAVRQGTKPTIIALTGHYDTKRFTDFRFEGPSDGG